MDLRDEAHSGFLLAGRYRLIAPIGSGGTAVVWRGHDDVLDRTVAIKMLAATELSDPESPGRIQHEARAAAALNHPNVAQVHDYGEMVTERGVFPYVVMEFVPGGTLLGRLRDGAVPPADAMRICSEIAAGLDAAHERGLVHRDIKPANVMLAPTGAKVVDFGIAAAVAPGRPTHEDFIVYGTPAYLAPERLIDDVVVPASDVYSLGILLYRLLSGRSPWDQEQTTRMLMAHVHLPPAPLPPLPGVPEDVVRLCHLCLAKEPEQRPVAREVAEGLARAIAAPALPGRPAPAGRVRKARLRWAAAGLTIAAVGGLGMVWTLAPDDRTETGSDIALPALSSPSPATSPASSDSPKPSPAASRPAQDLFTKFTTPPAATTTAPEIAPSRRPSTNSAPATTAAPAGTDPPARPVERTFSSEAGSIRVTCPTAGTAQILSWSATKSYKIGSSDPGPAAAAYVTFQRGRTGLTMTVTCDGDQPTVTRTTSP